MELCNHGLTATKVAGKNSIVMTAMVFIAELSRLLDRVSDRVILFSS